MLCACARARVCVRTLWAASFLSFSSSFLFCFVFVRVIFSFLFFSFFFFFFPFFLWAFLCDGCSGAKCRANGSRWATTRVLVDRQNMPSWRLSLKKARVQRKNNTPVNKLLSLQGASHSVSSTPPPTSQTEQAPQKAFSAIDGQVRFGNCPICNLSIRHLLFLEQEVHVNQCLDVKLNDERLSRDRAQRSGASTGTESRSERESTVWCPLCDADLSSHTVASRIRHTDECMKLSLPPDPGPAPVGDTAWPSSQSAEGSAHVDNLEKPDDHDNGTKYDELAKTDSESEDCFSEADIDGGGENQLKTGKTVDHFAATDYDDNFDSQEAAEMTSARSPPDMASSTNTTPSGIASIPTTIVKKPSAFAVLMRRGNRRETASDASRRRSAAVVRRGSTAVLDKTPTNAFEVRWTFPCQCPFT